MKSSNRLIWVDCEMTGLDPSRHVILEIASVITDYDLKVIAQGPVLAIRQTESALGRMDAWPRRTHMKSGLLTRIKSGVHVTDAEKQTLRFVRTHCEARVSPLCGNSVGTDKQFLAKYMPKLVKFLNYRIIDVSSIKLLAAAWYGKRSAPPPKQSSHTAATDIAESIAELRYYRDNFFVSVDRHAKRAGR